MANKMKILSRIHAKTVKDVLDVRLWSSHKLMTISFAKSSVISRAAKRALMHFQLLLLCVYCVNVKRDSIIHPIQYPWGINSTRQCLKEKVSESSRMLQFFFNLIILNVYRKDLCPAKQHGPLLFHNVLLWYLMHLFVTDKIYKYLHR